MMPANGAGLPTLKSDQNWEKSKSSEGLISSMTAPVTAANFEEYGLNNTTSQTEYNSELGLQFPSRGEQFAAGGGTLGPQPQAHLQELQCRCGGRDRGRMGRTTQAPSSPRGMYSEPWQQAGDQKARCGRGGYSHGKAGLIVADWGTLKSGGILPEDWIHPQPGGLSPVQMVGGCSPRHQALLLRTLDLAWGSRRRRNERMRWEPQRISCSGQQTTASGRTVSP